jgi:dipeptidyl aminopeptidase/acylaminoacyl peptidase
MAKQRFITAEDLWRIKRPSSPTLSPDGSQVCITLTSYDMEENSATSHLWLLSTSGGAPRALTQCGEQDGQPRWSPDGSLIAFVAKRGNGKNADEAAQIYLIAPDGGEARRLTNIATGASAIKWFADSRRIAFISWVWPDLKNEKEQAARTKAKKDNKVKAIITDQLQYRYWDHWIADGRVPCVHVVDVASGKTLNIFSGSNFQLPLFDPEAKDYDLSPDGKCVVFNFNPSKEKLGDQVHQLVEVEIKGGKAKTLSLKSPLDHRYPAYSPDGKSIAFLVRDYRRSINDNEKLALIDRTGGKLSVLSQHWDRSINAPLKWADDGASIYFTADDSSRLSVWQMRLEDDEPAIVAPGGTVTDFDVRGDVLAFVRNNMSSAPKVFAAGADGGKAKPIEKFNDALMAEFRLGEVRDFTIKGWNGEAVQMWAVYPPNFDAKKKWPLLHSIHGGPHSNWGDNFHFRWNNQVFAAQGYVVVCVNYHGSQGFGQKFLEAIMGSLGTKEHADVEAGTDFMLKQGYIDAKRLAATGGSYGGKMVAWMNGRNGAKKGGDRYKAYVCHAGCFDWVSMYAEDVGYWFQYELKANYWDQPEKVAAQNPITFARHMKTPTLVLHGSLDYRVPDNQAMAYYNTLKSLGVDARLVLFPDENHWILKPQNSRLWYREYFQWLDKYLGKGAV